MTQETGPVVVPARADEPAVLALLADYAEELAARGIVLHQDEGGSVTPEEMAPPRGAFHVVTLGGRPVACGGVRLLDPGTAEVKRMYVAPTARRRGVARTLLGRLEQDARDLGCSAVRLDTGPGMDAAITLYRASGYREVDDYNGNPHAGHWFEKALARQGVPADRLVD
ncbi:GNAT family N-acetyltransferase [Nocardioides campestrisoli]|uniref:GNAT family N-acetyltransferase n=1 Tax=Nocardioides campestrisoli TaxID=2736757 RepID=UPI0015E7C7FA|nr:GNAT family N-acetyltransferase [Nocardioides campestrisoli]